MLIHRQTLQETTLVNPATQRVPPPQRLNSYIMTEEQPEPHQADMSTSEQPTTPAENTSISEQATQEQVTQEQTTPAEPSTTTSSTDPELEIAFDMAKRSVFFAVPLALAGLLIWGWFGLASVCIALGVVVVNFLFGARIIAFGARSGFATGAATLMATILGGYLLRLAIIAVVILTIRHFYWFEATPFAVSLLTTHLGLLALEHRYVSLTAAYPGLKPGHPQHQQFFKASSNKEVNTASHQECSS